MGISKSIKHQEKKKDNNTQSKERFLEYFRQLPVQKLAAAHIGKDEDTITNWKKEDSDFSDQVEDAKAAWALKHTKKVKSEEWLLERIMNDHFTEKKKLELEGDLRIEVVSYDAVKNPI